MNVPMQLYETALSDHVRLQVCHTAELCKGRELHLAKDSAETQEAWQAILHLSGGRGLEIVR
jgi:hypothetical protein